jgi:HAD superfamily hydrolase (TIGR01450 family)
MAWVLDLDGVVWLVDKPIPGAPEAIAQLRAAGKQVLFLSNNSGPKIADYLSKLQGMGIPAAAADVVTSAQTAAGLVEPGTRVLLCAGPGTSEAMIERGAVIVAGDEQPDVVVVGLTTAFDYNQLKRASVAIRRGARFLATNDDATYPTPEGPIPGSGSLVAAVRTASGHEPEVAGKPYPPTVDALRRRGGNIEVVVGDRPNTDGLLAHNLGVPFALVLTGVTGPDDLPIDPAPDQVAADLAEVVRTRL